MKRIRGMRMWKSVCECVTTRIVRGAHLVSGASKSCGCRWAELARNKFTFHGMSNTPEFKTWKRMRERCCHPSNISYQYYGAKGIKVCDRWMHSFPNFYEDMGNRPSKHHSLDRIDNNKGYEPGNCRWATSYEQQNNKRSSRFITSKGETHTEAQWNRILGFKRQTIWGRIYAGWDVEEAIWTPLQR